MDRILYTAMSGARQSMDQQSVVSNNLANASTTGFRGQMQALRAVPVQGADFSAGPMNATGRDLDVAMQGDAWLAVQATNGDEAYTRRGDLQVDGDGVLNSAGRPVIGEGGPIIVPLGAKLSMGADGTLSAIGAGEDPDALVRIGRVKLVNGGEGELQRGEDGLFRGPQGALPMDENARLVSGALEGSNVSPVESMVAMIDNGRRYEMQMKVIDTADQNAQRADSLLSIQ